MKNALIILFILLLSACLFEVNKDLKLKSEKIDRLERQLEFTKNTLLSTREHVRDICVREQRVVVKTVVKEMDREVKCASSSVRTVASTFSVEKKDTPKRNLIGLSIGVSRSELSTEVNSTTVTINRKFAPVLSADYTRMLTGRWGISGQISTNEAIQIGIKYAF